MNWYLKVIRNYVGFSGRARRTEYWMFVLFNLLIAFGIGLVEGLLGLGSLEAGGGPISLLYALAIFLPSLAVTIRRLHDTGKTGWWILLAIVPIIGPLVLLFFFVTDSEPGTNAYGPNPKG